MLAAMLPCLLARASAFVPRLPLRAPLPPPHFYMNAERSEDLIIEQFNSWLSSTAPAGAAPAAPVSIEVSSATTVEGALRDVWCSAVAASQPGAPEVSVLLLPHVPWLEPWERFTALHKHLLSCRDCCPYFGQTIRIGPLHPLTEAEPTEVGASIADLRNELSETEAQRKRAPMPAFTFTSRVGPRLLQPVLEEDASPDLSAVGSSGDPPQEASTELDDEVLQAARRSLERQFSSAEESSGGNGATAALPGSGGSSVEPPLKSNAAILEETMEWWTVYFARVHRIFGQRQRRTVQQAAGAEEAYATFWAEAATLAGDASSEAAKQESAAASQGAVEEVAQRAEPASLQPVDAVSSLVVLPGLSESDYRAVRQTLALSLPFLGLTQAYAISAFHPRDTFEVVEGPDGRRWEMSLPHPLIHLVRKRTE